MEQLMTDDQQSDLDTVEQKYLQEFLGAVDAAKKSSGVSYGPALVEHTPFLLYCSTLRQERIIKAMQEESVKTAALLTETQKAVAEMRTDSNRIKWLTVALFVLTAALVYFAYRLDTVESPHTQLPSASTSQVAR
jgi:hypothetical protein